MFSVIVVSALAGARLWRLLAVDTLAMPIRNKVDGWSVYWRDFYYCPFCMGFWLTAIVLAVGVFTGPVLLWWVIAGSLAANYLGAHIGSRID